MRLVVISDTHGLHNELSIPPADVILHAGDVSMEGKDEEVMEFLSWFSKLPHPYKIFIAGNHDFFFENKTPGELQSIIPSNLIYLNDSGVTINGIHIWGSPIQPVFMNWAFTRERGAEIRKHWDMIPDDTDILITHGPPHLILDVTPDGIRAGCEELRKKVFSLKPRYHIFGHMHAQHSSHNEGGVQFINAANLDYDYKVKYPPIVFDIDKKI